MNTNVSKLRHEATEIWTAGLDSVRAGPLVNREVVVSGDELQIREMSWNRRDFDRVIVVGGGKAGSSMAAGLVQSLGNWLPITGWINVPADTLTEGNEVGGIHLHAARPAGVNEPTAEGVQGVQNILQLVQSASERDLCIALISGGGSALMPAPIDGIDLNDKLLVTRFLSGAGANIGELNTVRKHLSQIKGGGLLQACRARELITLILSDVLGDPLDLIASGPTVSDTSTSKDALSVLKQFDPERRLPDRIYQALIDATDQSPTATTQSTPLVIGNNALAVDEAGIKAESLGYNHAMQSARQCEGAAEVVGERLADMSVQMLRADPNGHRMDCLITGGEPTVKLAAEEIRGKGGRNQQLVLAAYKKLLSLGLSDDEWSRICLLSGGTDGEDGPTDAAGAILDKQVHERTLQLGLDVDDFLSRNDAYAFFAETGGLLMTGPTGTNVCDVRVSIVDVKNH